MTSYLNEHSKTLKTAASVHDKRLLSRLQLFRNVDMENPELLDLLDMMIASADVAMYHARRNGKNRVEIAADVPVDK